MNKILLPALICLTLGLAPYVPEPHIVGKIRWILGGAHGMQRIDWVDFFLHGAPWMYLIGVIISAVKGKSYDINLHQKE